MGPLGYQVWQQVTSEAHVQPRPSNLELLASVGYVLLAIVGFVAAIRTLSRARRSERAPLKARWIVVLSLGGALTIAAGAASFLGLLAQTWMTNAQTRMLDTAKDGERFGKTHPASACAPEALRVADACGSSDTCTIGGAGFAMVCQQSTGGTETFCVGVPDGSDERASEAWLRVECAHAGKRPDDERCNTILFSRIQNCALYASIRATHPPSAASTSRDP